MPEVSIVVPVYNVEKYLARCIDSLVKQTLKDIEIILVDDGSKDQSGDICDRYALEDQRIKIVHKSNGGLSSARNAGLDKASGKYVGFVDSDDDVEPDMYEQMLRTAERYDVDFVMSDYIRVLDNNSCYLKTLDIEGGYYDRKKIRKIIFPNLIMGEDLDYGPLLSVWHCLYRRGFLAENDLCFDEQVRWSEDNIFSAILGYKCSSFYYLKGVGLYHYHQNPGTITTAYRQGAWKIYCIMNDHLHSFFDNVRDYDFSRQMKMHVLYYACNCVGMECRRPQNQALHSIRLILDDEKLADAFKDLSLSGISFKLKIQLLLMKYRLAGVLFFLLKR